MLLANLATATTLITFVYGLIGFRRFSIQVKLLCILAGVSFFCDLAGFLFRFVKINPNHASNVYMVVEFTLLILIYYKAMGLPRFRTPFMILAGLFYSFSIANFSFFQREAMNSYSVVISSLIFIVLSIAYFYKLMVDLPTLQLSRLPMFWINVAVLVYFAGNLFLFVISQYLVNTMNSHLMIYWSFHQVVTITRNFLHAAAFYLGLRTAVNPL